MSGRRGRGGHVTGNDDVTRRRRTSVDRSSDRSRDRSTDSESSVSTTPSAKNDGIRTRLSTGSIHMNGTTTIAVAREIENNQKLSGTFHRESPTKTVPQTKKTVVESTVKIPQDTVHTPPSSTVGMGKKRGASALVVEAAVPGQLIPPKKRKIGRNDGSGEDNRNDYFCWLCHKEGTVVCCELCPRVYHSKCLELGSDLPQDWVCPECEKVMRAECIDTRSKAMSMITLDTLCTLLKYALERMKHQGCDPFEKPVDTASVTHYTDYIYNPMDLSQLERNIKKKMYGCTEAFLADAKWILHNCIIFNGTHHKLTSSAKMIIKICKHEMSEIELCPDCYLNSCIRKNDEWFSETCRTPHPLVWAKLKGYPFWPAKALREVDGQVDVRFFGAHDRSWVSTSQVFMLCKEIPTHIKNKKGGFENAMEELEKHIEKLSAKFGKYEYAPFRTPYDQKNVYNHIKLKYKPGTKLSKRRKFGGNVQKADAKTQIGGSKLGRIIPASERQLVGQKTAYVSLVKSIDKAATTTTKTASAVKNKYNSIITTRRGLNRTGTDASSDSDLSPVKKIIRVTSDIDKVVGKIIATDTPVKKLTEVEKNSDSSSEKANTFKAKSDILDKIQSKIKAMEQCDEEDGSENTNMETDFGKLENETDIVKSDIIDSAEKLDSAQASAKSQLKTPDCEKEDTKSESDRKNLVKMKSDDSELMQTKSLDSESEREIYSDDSSSPSKKEYLENLQKTIQSCKNKLGIVGEETPISDDDDGDVDEDDDDDDDGDDNDEKVSDDENDDNDEMEVEKKESVDDKKKSVHQNDGLDHSDNLKITSVVGNSEAEESVQNKKETTVETLSKTVSEKNKSDIDKNIKSTTSIDIVKKADKIDSDNEKKSESLEPSVISKILNSDRVHESEKISDVVNTEEADSELCKGSEILKLSEKSKNNDKDDVKNEKSRKETIDEPGLMMEVESESDNERSSMDLEDDRVKTCTPTKIREDSKSEIKVTVVKRLQLLDIDESKSSSLKSSTDNIQKKDNKMEAVSKVEKVVEPTRNSPSIQDKTKTIPVPVSEIVKTISLGPKSPPGVKSPVTPTKTARKKSVSPKQNNKKVESPSSDTDMILDTGPELDKKSLVDKFTKTLMSKIEGTFQDVCTEFVNTELEPKLQGGGSSESLKQEINKLEWEQQQQLYELKHNFQLTVSEMKACWEAEKQRLVAEVKSMCQKEKETALLEAKKKQWCANCGKEAIFYCCWNTSYCDYPCQQAHWPTHMPNCMQTQQSSNDNVDANEKAKSSNEKTAEGGQSSQDQGSRPPSNRQTPVGVGQPQMVVSSPSAVNVGPQPSNVHDGNIHQPMDEIRRQTRDGLVAAIQRQEEQRQMQYIHGSPNVQSSPEMGVPFMHVRSNVPQGPPGNAPFHYGQESPEGNQNKPNVWTEETMNKACLAVIQGGLSVNKAAKVYRVPRQKLGERVSGKQQPQQPSPNALSGQPIMHTNQGISNQPIRLQYVQPPQQAMTLPPHPGQQQFSPVRMQAVQIQNQPMPGSIIPQRPMMQQNNSMVYPLHLRQSHPNSMIPGNQLIISQGQRPPPPNVMQANVPYRY